MFLLRQRLVKVVVRIRRIGVPVCAGRPRLDPGPFPSANVRRLSFRPDRAPVCLLAAAIGELPSDVADEIAGSLVHTFKMAQNVAVLQEVVGSTSGGGLDDTGKRRVFPDVSPVRVAPEGGHVVVGHYFTIVNSAVGDSDGRHGRALLSISKSESLLKLYCCNTGS